MDKNKFQTKIIFFSAVLCCSVFVFSFLLFPLSTQASTKTWDSGGANDNCSTAGNWDNDTAPIATDDIVINSTADAIIWDSACPQTVASMLIDTGFTGSVQINTTYTGGGFDVFTITNNLTINAGTVKHKDNSTAETYRLNLSVGGNFTLGASGTINVDGLGYDAGNGPGRPTDGEAGGGHGGSGGLYGSGSTYSTATYGSATVPINIGSGGSQSYSGGGAIILNITGTSTINGTVSSIGGGSGRDAGSGGSIYLTTGIISGSGTLSVNGGAGNGESSGGGGRVAVILTGSGADFSSFSGSTTAYGGVTSGASRRGAAGTVYKQTQAQGTNGGQLIIDNNSVDAGLFTTRIPSGQTLVVGSAIVQNKGNLELMNGGSLSVPTLTVGNNGIITAIQSGGQAVNYTGNIVVQSGGVITHPTNSTAETYKLNLTITGNLTVDSGGTINVDGLGYTTGNGPGRPLGDWAGGSYGGIGGADTQGNLGSTYGSITTPINLGSGGGSCSGGGVVIITIIGTITVNGSVSANGSGCGKDGSGGSILLTTSSISGNGSIQANGGGNSRSGGGGRVAVILTGNSANFSGYSGTITAYGGSGSSRYGGAGTVYKKTASQTYGDLIIDNNSYVTVSGSDTRISSLVTDTTVGTITTQNKGNLTIDNGQTLTIAGTGTTLTVGTGTTLTNNGTLNLGGTTFTNSGTFTSTASTSTVNYTGQTDDSTVTMIPTTYYNLATNNTATQFNLGGATTVNNNLTITAGTFNPATYAVTGTGTNTLTITDTANADASTFAGSYASFETITLGTSSTVNYTRTNTQTIDNTLTYKHLTISGSNTKTLGGTTTVAGNLTITAGTLASANYNLNVAGNFTNSVGTGGFTAGTATVTLNGTNQTISGNTTFYNLTFSPSQTITFTAGTTQTIQGTMTCTGSQGNIIALASSTTSPFTLSKASGTVTCNYLNISYSTAEGGAIWIPGLNSTNQGNNQGWDFTAPTNIGIASITPNSSTELTITAQTAQDLLSGLHTTPYYFAETTGNTGSSSSADWQASAVFTDAGLLPNTIYTYKVKAKDTAGNQSDYSTTVSAYTKAPTPTNLTATVNSSQSITLSVDTLTNQTLNSSGYYFERTSNTQKNSGWIQTNTWQDTDPNFSCSGEAYTVKYRNQQAQETSTISVTAKPLMCGGGGGSGALGFAFSQSATANTLDSRLHGNDSGTDNPQELARLQTIIDNLKTQIQALLNKTTPGQVLGSNTTTPDMPNLTSNASTQPLFTQTLKLGSKGTEVTILQNKLKELGFFPAQTPANGYFGKVTLKAVQDFQVKNNIVSPEVYGYGIVGPKTREFLNRVK